MSKCFSWIVCIALAPFAGCGGGTESLTGGSIPVGGRSVTGAAMLPDSSPAAGASVSVRTFPAGTLIATTVTDASGRFRANNVPVSSDIDITVTQPPSNVLELVVPQAELVSGTSQTVDIGSVTAISSLVAAAIKLEQMNAPQDENSIVANQPQHLADVAEHQGLSANVQNQLISNRNSMNAQALALMVPVANSELTLMNQSPSAASASAALYGLLGYLRAAHNRYFIVTPGVGQALINAQVKGTLYSADDVAVAMQQAGLKQVTGNQIAAASTRERIELTAFSVNGMQISPFEALVIATDVTTNGGFQCDQRTLDAFLTNLLPG